MNRFESVTAGTASHSTWLPNDGNQVAGYKPLRWLMALLLVAFVAGCGNGGGGRGPILGGGGVGVALAPTVTSTVPANLDTGVQINRRLTATFSELMDPATITGVPASFKVTGPLLVAVPGTVTYSGLTAVFTPTSALAASSVYTATVTTVVKNQAGRAMAANYAWSFTTGLTADTTSPTVISTDVSNGTTGLPVNRNSTATFSEPMDPTTLVSTLVSPSPSYTVCSTAVQGGACVGANVVGVVTYLGNTATFNPNVDLSPNTWYKSTISTAATDLAFNPLIGGLVPNPWNWQTGPVADIIPPTITSTNPANDLAAGTAGSGLIPITQTINATFSEAMSPATMVTANFTVKDSVTSANVTGTVAYDAASNIASFLPQISLTPDTSYTATVSTGAKDLANNALFAGAAPNPWTFRTAPIAVPPVPLAINLGTASTYGIASRAGMTSSGVTTVNGDIALWPLATCTDATGGPGGAAVPPPGCAVKAYGSHPTGLTVNGSVYFAGGADALIAQQVTNDLNTAWIQGFNKLDTKAGFFTGQLGGPGPVGKTVTPGVYNEANLGFAAGTVATFDGLGDNNAIFIIKVGTVAGAGAFTDSGTLALPTQIKLTGGAQAKNIWFVVGSAANIGTGTIWNGNILAGGTLTISGGSTVTGRLLAGANGAGAFTMTTGAPLAAPITVTVP
jgi:hypothetical protein